MSRSLNRATIIGNLGADPELRTTPQGRQVCTLNIATSEAFKDSDGEWKERTEWHRVVLWDRLAEIANQFLRKGRKVFVEGRLKTRSYEKDGINRYVTEIVAQTLILVDNKPNQEANIGYGQVDDSTVQDIIDEDDVPF